MKNTRPFSEKCPKKSFSLWEKVFSFRSIHRDWSLVLKTKKKEPFIFWSLFSLFSLYILTMIGIFGYYVFNTVYCTSR